MLIVFLPGMGRKLDFSGGVDKMPTYDYICRKCGFENEYRNVPSDGHPACEGCGSDEHMHRLPSRINIGGISASTRKVTAEDFTGTVEGLELHLGSEECKDCGGIIPVVKDVRHFKYDKGLSAN
jgi:putative FmdB family regulatory protein